MIYVIYIGKLFWTCCETLTQTIRQINIIKCHHATLIKSSKIKIYAYTKHADITKHINELLNS